MGAEKEFSNAPRRILPSDRVSLAVRRQSFQDFPSGRRALGISALLPPPQNKKPPHPRPLSTQHGGRQILSRSVLAVRLLENSTNRGSVPRISPHRCGRRPLPSTGSAGGQARFSSGAGRTSKRHEHGPPSPFGGPPPPTPFRRPTPSFAVVLAPPFLGALFLVVDLLPDVQLPKTIHADWRGAGRPKTKSFAKGFDAGIGPQNNWAAAEHDRCSGDGAR